MYKYPEEIRREMMDRVLRKALLKSKVSIEELTEAFNKLPKGEKFEIDPRHIC